MSRKLIGIIASFALVLSLVGGSVAQAAALTASQISAIVSLLQSFGADATTVANVTASLNGQATPGSGTPVVTGDYSFTSDMTLGSTGAAVTALQQVLVNQGYLVMPTGVSMGYFGALTRSAVIKFQLAKGIAPAVGYVGSITRGVLNGMATGGVVTPGGTVFPTGTDLKVSLAPTSPSTGAVVAGQSIANLVEYKFTNTSNVPAVITNVSLQRGGVSNDSALTNVYLYNGVNRLTDSASISTGNIAFNAPTGLFTVPAGSSMTVAVRSDISASSTSGQLIIISLTGVTSNVPVSAVYPIAGATQQISSATLATVAVASSSPTTASIDPQNDYVMWQGTATVGNNDVWLKSLALRQIGSVAAGELSNFKLYNDGIQVGGTLLGYDGNGYLTFDLSASPIKLTTGTHTLKLVGDIIGGSTKNFSFSLRQASDINTVDSQLNVNVLATASAGFPLTSGTQTVNSGTITITKKTDSPSGNVTLLSTGATLARFEVKAAGEPMKVESLNVKYTHTPANVTFGTLRNGALFANGAQIGSTAAIASTSAGTTYNLGSSLIVYPGAPVTLEVRGDIYATGAVQFTNGTTTVVSLVAGSSNVQKLKSLSYTSSSAADGNTLTISQGTLSLSKQGAYANQSVVAPQTAMKIGQFTLTAGTTEDLNLNTINLGFHALGGTNSSTTESAISDVYVVYGPKTTNVKATISTSSLNVYSINHTLAKGQTIDISVYATLASSIGGSDTIIPKLSVVGQTAQSSQTVTIPSTNATQGQTISVTSGVLTPSAYATPASTTVIAGSLVKAGSFKFAATGDTFTVDQLVGYVPFASAGNVASVVYKVGGTTLNPGGTAIDTSDGTNAIATTTGVNIVVPANSSAGVIVDAYLQLATIGTPGAATSSSNVLFVLDGFRKMTSTGVQTNAGSQALSGNVQYAYASVPTITNENTAEMGTSASLTAGDKTLARIKISADAAGSIDWGMIQFAITKPVAVNLGTGTSANGLNATWSFTDDSGSAIAGSFSTTTGSLDLAATSGNIRFKPTNPETIAAGSSKIYRLKTNVSGIIAANDAVTTKIAAGTAGHLQSTTFTLATSSATFTWSDNSYNPHSVTSPDWNSDNLVKNIPTDSQVLLN